MSEQPTSVLHWIGGERAASARTSASVNPATGEVIGSYADADAETGQAAVDAAARAFTESPWRLDPMLRAAALAHLADAYEARTGDIVATLCRENGKLAPEAGYEAHFISRALRFAAGLAVHPHGRAADVLPGTLGMSIRQAAGVAGLIIPWNSPAYLSVRALAPALAAGCTTVVKMPGQAAQTAGLMSEIIASVPEIPAGAVNIVIESGSEVAKLLVDSPQVPVISFTGSTATGRVIGCGIVGPNAGDLISEAALAIEMGAEAEDIGLTIHPHPTLSETFAMSAEAFAGTLTDLYMPKKK